MIKQKIEKMQFPILIMVFVMTLSVSSLFKPSINKIDATRLAKDVYGVGDIKSTKIIQERNLNGDFKNEKDFYHRTKKLGIGEVVFNRINKKYKF